MKKDSLPTCRNSKKKKGDCIVSVSKIISSLKGNELKKTINYNDN